jgi:hypothetical protein
MLRCRTSRAAPLRRHPVQLGHRIHRAIDGYATRLVRLIGESYGQHTVQRAWREFTVGRDQTFYGYDANAELFFSWLFHQWTPVREKGDELRDATLYGIPPTRAYLERRPAGLNPLLRQYLQACLATSPRFYEVVNCSAGHGFRARDIFTNVVHTVSEVVASTSLERGHILYAHLIPLGQITLLDAISPLSFPPQSKLRLLQSCPGGRAREPAGADFRRLYFNLCASAAR